MAMIVNGQKVNDATGKIIMTGIWAAMNDTYQPKQERASTMTRQELKNRRTALGLTQAQMAEAVGRSGVTYSRWEQGLINVPEWLHGKVEEMERGKGGGK